MKPSGKISDILDKKLINDLKAEIQIPHQTIASVSKQLELQQHTIETIMKPILSTMNEKLLKNISTFNHSSLEFFDMSLITEQIEKLRISTERIFSPVINALKEAFKDLPADIEKALNLLAIQGWYIDLEMTTQSIIEIGAWIEDGDEKKADDCLVEHFENRMDEIEASLIETFPNRANLISAAFFAHRLPKYELSIPVFLSQTDGICNELFNGSFFMKDSKDNTKPQTAKYVDQIEVETLLAAFLSPLASTLPINASKKQRESDFNQLNRHQVLHGESVGYGTKINSLKAISLINYVALFEKTNVSNV